LLFHILSFVIFFVRHFGQKIVLPFPLSILHIHISLFSSVRRLHKRSSPKYNEIDLVHLMLFATQLTRGQLGRRLSFLSWGLHPIIDDAKVQETKPTHENHFPVLIHVYGHLRNRHVYIHKDV
jgi:hypothetical protein